MSDFSNHTRRIAPPVTIGVIGAGQIGKYHLSEYSKIPGAQVVAVADINHEEAQRVAEQYGIPHVYSDYRELLMRDDLMAVDVCLHNNLHMPVTLAAFEAGKHVYCEKPMAGAYVDAERMLSAAREYNRLLHIQNRLFFTNETKAAQALIEEGLLGKLYHARSTGFRRRGRPYVDGYGSEFFVKKEHAAGGALYDMGVYHIGQLLYLLGNPDVLTITGKTYQETPIDPDRAHRSGYDVEELGLGFVRLDDQITLDIIESWAVHLDNFEGSSIMGSAGGVRLDPFGYFFSVGDLTFNATADLGNFAYRLQQLRPNSDAYVSPQHHWIAVLQGRAQLIPSAEISLAVMLISEGIYLSEQLGREVTAEEVRASSRSTALAG